MFLRSLCACFFSLVLLASCGGSSSSNSSNTTPSPVDGVSMQTLQSNLGVVMNTPRAIKGASTFDGATDGSFTVSSDGGNPRMAATVGGLTTPVVLTGRGTTVDVMDGQVRQTTRDGDVFYLPAHGSNVNVGMVRRNTLDQSVVGIFGRETSQADLAQRINADATASYTGRAEISIDDPVRRTVDGYAGEMTATVDFGRADVRFSSKPMANVTQGTGTAQISGAGTFFPDGSIRGGFGVSHPIGEDLGGSVNGAFYGPNANDIGLIFVAPGTAGGAILDAD